MTEKAAQELELAAREREQQMLREKYPLVCPDCGAQLRVEVDPESPHGYRLIHVRHAS